MTRHHGPWISLSIRPSPCSLRTSGTANTVSLWQADCHEVTCQTKCQVEYYELGNAVRTQFLSGIRPPWLSSSPCCRTVWTSHKLHGFYGGESLELVSDKLLGWPGGVNLPGATHGMLPKRRVQGTLNQQVLYLIDCRPCYLSSLLIHAIATIGI